MKKVLVAFVILCVLGGGAYGGYAWWNGSQEGAEGEEAYVQETDADVPSFQQMLIRSADSLVAADALRWELAAESTLPPDVASPTEEKTFPPQILQLAIEMEEENELFGMVLRLGLAGIWESIEDLLPGGASPETLERFREEIDRGIVIETILEPDQFYLQAPQILGEEWFHQKWDPLFETIEEFQGETEYLKEDVEQNGDVEIDYRDHVFDRSSRSVWLKSYFDNIKNARHVETEVHDNKEIYRYEGRYQVDMMDGSTWDSESMTEEEQKMLQEMRGRIPDLTFSFWFDPEQDALVRVAISDTSLWNTQASLDIEYLQGVEIAVPPESQSLEEIDWSDPPTGILVELYEQMVEEAILSREALLELNKRDHQRRADLRRVGYAIDDYAQEQLTETGERRHPPVDRYHLLEEHLVPEFIERLPEAPQPELNYRYNTDEDGHEYALGTWLESAHSFWVVGYYEKDLSHETLVETMQGDSPFVYEMKAGELYTPGDAFPQVSRRLNNINNIATEVDLIYDENRGYPVALEAINFQNGLPDWLLNAEIISLSTYESGDPAWDIYYQSNGSRYIFWTDDWDGNYFQILSYTMPERVISDHAGASFLDQAFPNRDPKLYGESRERSLGEDSLANLQTPQQADAWMRADIGQLSTALEMYYEDYLTYPVSEETVSWSRQGEGNILAEALVPDYLSVMHESPVTREPSTREYHYWSDGTQFKLWTILSDGRAYAKYNSGHWLEAERQHSL